MKKQRIAIFAYSWTSSKATKLDSYLDRFVSEMSKLGFDVDVYIANHFTSHAGVLGIGGEVDIDRFNRYLGSNDYKMVLSFNNALVTKKTRGSINCPIISLVVDDFNHLFNHDLSGIYDQFSLVDKVMFSSFAHMDRLLANNELVKGKVYFYPTATSVNNVKKVKDVLANERFSISWVASLLDVSGITLLYQRCVNDSDRIELLNRAVRSVRRGEELRSSDHFGEATLGALLREHGWTFGFFEMQIQNLISNESRVAAANRLHALGLTIFGNLEWINASGYNPKILDVYQAGASVNSHADIMRIYNSSKICVNIPQIQTGSALPYRVIDIMASKALLITSYHPCSDLFRIFGQDCPVVMYKDLDHLYSLCEYYLLHEDERESLVSRCNKLVSSGFDFSDRCADILQLANVPAQDEASVISGDVTFVDKNNFVPFFTRLIIYSKFKIKVTVKRLLLSIPLSIGRSLILNIRGGR